MPRPRPIYFVAILVVITLGLLSRRYPSFLPAALGKYPGDALWALMVFLGFGCWFRRAPTVVVALAAGAFSVAIEVSQLYHAPWIDAVRVTLPGRLVLGSGFAWGDLAAYAIGILCGVCAEMICRGVSWRGRKPPAPHPCIPKLSVLSRARTAAGPRPQHLDPQTVPRNLLEPSTRQSAAAGDRPRSTDNSGMHRRRTVVCVRDCVPEGSR